MVDKDAADVKHGNECDTEVQGNTSPCNSDGKPEIENPEVADLGHPGDTKVQHAVGETAPVFPEIAEILGNSVNATPDPSPLLTLSQFKNTAHSRADMVMRGEDFTQCPSFGKWANQHSDLVPETP